MRYAFIQDHCGKFPIAVMCRLLGVGRSGLYAAKGRPVSDRSRQDIALRIRIEEMHVEQKQAAGIIKTWHLLRAEGIVCGRNRVARLRRLAGIETLRTAQYRRTRSYQKTEAPAPDLVQRQFDVPVPNRIWVGDITYILTRKGPLYLAAYIDLCTHSVTGWATSTKQTSDLVIQALDAGIKARRPGAGLICHTDQGSQFASTMYRNHLKDNQIAPSMSRRGNCHDNAVAESFFSNLKNEVTHHTTFDDPESAMIVIGEYIDVYYNRQRLHQTLGYRTPAQVETLHMCAQ